MAEKELRSFLNHMRAKLYPEPEAKVTDPHSPPLWKRLGWKVGWIIEESYTGIQWCLTDEENWEKLTSHLGNNRQQKTQMFVNWYSRTLKKLADNFGVPLRLESIRWRQIDLSAIVNRPRIQDETWWEISFTDDELGTWYLIIPQRFHHLFEEEETAPAQARPSWHFSELWKKLEDRQCRRLLELIAPHRGLRNHVAALIIGGVLESENVFEHLPATPSGELKTALHKRRRMLDKQTNRQREQTLKQWAKDADFYLTRKLGKWLEEEKLKGEGWQKYRADWKQFRIKQLEKNYGADNWRQFWKQFDDQDLKHIVPRLNFEQLSRAAIKLSEKQRSRIAGELPAQQQEKFKKMSARGPDRELILKARQEIHEQVEEIADKHNLLDS